MTRLTTTTLFDARSKVSDITEPPTFPKKTVTNIPIECFHCGLPASTSSTWQVTIQGQPRAMCCPGCQAVAQAIVNNGFSAYYETRTGFAATPDAALLPPELQLLDAKIAAPNQARDGKELELTEAIFSIEGIRCAACVWLIERRLARLTGLQSVSVNVTHATLKVAWDKRHCGSSDILRCVREVGYAAFPFDQQRHSEHLERMRKTLFRQLFIAGLAMMQVMMYALPAYLATDGTMDAGMGGLMRWASLLLTLPAVGYSALPFFRGAWINLKNGMPGMDVPVALGIAAAFAASVVATWRGQGEVYFDSVTMFIFLLLCGRYLELVARRQAASALDKLHHALPASALRMPAYPASHEVELIAAAQLQIGDVILVKPGQAIAADGVLIEGDTSVDLSLLTGESQAVRKTVGDVLPGGAVNTSQPIVLRVTQTAGSSTLSAIVNMVERAGLVKPQLAQWADKVAAWFVVALLLLAVTVFALWYPINPARAWMIAVAVLVVSCPCALSLATPTALAAATDRLLRQGILIVRPHVLETLHRATHIVFDKTGTLTEGRPVVRHVDIFDAAVSNNATGEPFSKNYSKQNAVKNANQKYLNIAATLEAGSTHPLGLAIIAAAFDHTANDDLFRSGTSTIPRASAISVQSTMSASDINHLAGQGIAGTVDCVRYHLGSATFVQALTQCAPPWHDTLSPELSSVYLGSSAGWLARFDLADGLRSDAQQIIQQFQSSGKTVILLSGDTQSVTQTVADNLGITTALGGHLPEQKLAYVQHLQSQGAVVVMVGDGINDAPVLRAADVSFAMGSGSALAQTHADCVLLSGQLSALSEVADSAGQTIAVVRQNLWWASLYNAVAIPAAALGLLNPWMIGVGMSVSSAVVVLNALRLRRVSSPRRRGANPALVQVI